MLQADGLAAFRGERLVFAGLGFSVAAGGALLLLGPNGAGKSTLLRLLAGLVPASSGRVLWLGEDALADRTAWTRQVAYLGHLDGVKPALTVAENLHFWGSPGAIGQALLAVGLEPLADLPARLLSAGQRRRLALARIALSPAPLWLLDEPATGLDDAAVIRLAAILATHRNRGGLVVAATHVALPLADAAALTLG